MVFYLLIVNDKDGNFINLAGSDTREKLESYWKKVKKNSKPYTFYSIEPIEDLR